jgi:hypothetical protein
MLMLMLMKMMLVVKLMLGCVVIITLLNDEIVVSRGMPKVLMKDEYHMSAFEALAKQGWRWRFVLASQMEDHPSEWAVLALSTG